MPPEDRHPVARRSKELSPDVPTADRAHPPAGQLGTFALLGAAIGTVPLPWLPDTLARRLRGALVQDIAARHGLPLSPGARTVLADPAGAKAKHGALAQAWRYIGRKLLVRFGPLAVVPPLRAGLETYVLGYLFDRYLSRGERPDGARVEVKEARVIRSAIDRAVLKVASPEGGLQWPAAPPVPEESRDEITQALDALLNGAATIPSWLLRRLDGAFDDVLSED